MYMYFSYAMVDVLAVPPFISFSGITIVYVTYLYSNYEILLKRKRNIRAQKNESNHPQQLPYCHHLLTATLPQTHSTQAVPLKMFQCFYFFLFFFFVYIGMYVYIIYIYILQRILSSRTYSFSSSTTTPHQKLSPSLTLLLTILKTNFLPRPFVLYFPPFTLFLSFFFFSFLYI